MLHIQSLIEREIGLSNLRYYDSVLPRLVVTWNDSYNGISPYMFGSDFNPEPPIFACRFAEKKDYEHYVAIANEDGKVAIQNTYEVNKSSGDHPPLEGHQCHENAVFDLSWMSHSMKFVTVSGDHTARLWDIGGESIRQCQVFYGHNKSVKTVAFRPDDNSVFATGARDGKILIWDTRAATGVDLIARPDNSIFNCHPVHSVKTPVSKRTPKHTEQPRANSITGLIFQKDDTLISCADGDGNIKIWDLRKNYTMYKRDPLPKLSIAYCGCSSKNGYTNLLFDKSRYVLYANCMDNVIYSFNVTAYSAVPVQRYVGHMNGTFYIKSSLSSDGQYLVSGSSDEKAYIWNIKYSQPIVQLEGHSAEVTCATWCQLGDIKIVTCSDDARHKIWRINKEYPEPDDLQDYRGTSKRYPLTKKVCPALDQTPQSLKRKGDFLDTSSKKKRTDRQSYTLTRKSSKRSLLSMLNGTLPTVREENNENEMNNLNLTSPTSSRIESEESPSTSKRHCPNSAHDGPSTSKRHCSNSTYQEEFDSVSLCLSPLQDKLKSPTFAPNIFTTPIKSPRKLIISPMTSPKHILTSPSLAGFEFPNFVLNGDAPHLGLMSPPKKVCRSVDWLTRLSIEKNANNSGCNISPQSSQITHRRNSATKTPNGEPSGNKTPVRSKISTSLLNYFISTKSAEKK